MAEGHIFTLVDKRLWLFFFFFLVGEINFIKAKIDKSPNNEQIPAINMNLFLDKSDRMECGVS